MKETTGVFNRQAVGDTAAAHMVTRFPRSSVFEKAAALLERLRYDQFDIVDTAYVIDEAGALIGTVDMADLLKAAGDQTMESLLQAANEPVSAEVDQETVALHAIEHNLAAVPVVDEEKRLIGVVPPRAIAGILRDEHLEDIARMAGITHADRRTHNERLTTPILTKARRRMPWLLAGLAGSAVATAVVASFEDLLARNIAVSFFMPALVYLAGAVGSQSVSVAVRDLSSSRPAIEELLLKELGTGLLIGLVLGAVMSAWTWFVFAEGQLWLAIGCAVFATATLSTVIGLLLPWMFERMNFDPALGSGPIATILQDVATLVLYFGIVFVILES